MFYKMNFNKIIEKYELRRQNLLLCDKEKGHDTAGVSLARPELNYTCNTF